MNHKEMWNELKKQLEERTVRFNEILTIAPDYDFSDLDRISELNLVLKLMDKLEQR